MTAVLAAPIWIPALTLASLLIFVTSGWPVFYRSKRRVFRSDQIVVTKFRAMIRNADRTINRDTVSPTDQLFLNIPTCSPFYTPAGRLLERLSLTEIPQIFHVLAGSMSIVGNRPLPENVIAAIKERFPDVEARFDTPAGMCGPIQLAGRDRLNDEDRLRIEIAYCRRCIEDYSWIVDLRILLLTVLRCMHLRKPMDVSQIIAMLGVSEPVSQQEAPSKFTR